MPVMEIFADLALDQAQIEAGETAWLRTTQAWRESGKLFRPATWRSLKLRTITEAPQPIAIPNALGGQDLKTWLIRETEVANPDPRSPELDPLFVVWAREAFFHVLMGVGAYQPDHADARSPGWESQPDPFILLALPTPLDGQKYSGIIASLGEQSSWPVPNWPAPVDFAFTVEVFRYITGALAPRFKASERGMRLESFLIVALMGAVTATLRSWLPHKAGTDDHATTQVQRTLDVLVKELNSKTEIDPAELLHSWHQLIDGLNPPGLASPLIERYLVWARERLSESALAAAGLDDLTTMVWGIALEMFRDHDQG